MSPEMGTNGTEKLGNGRRRQERQSKGRRPKVASSSLLSSCLIAVCTENRAVGNALEQTAVIQ